MRRKHRLTKAEKEVISFWICKKLKRRFYQICEDQCLVKERILSQIVSDFCEGLIYALPKLKPLNRGKLVHYKDDDGKWIYLTPDEFLERVERKNRFSTKGEDMDGKNE